ncbi:hypothetical protein [Algoriphagus sp.]
MERFFDSRLHLTLKHQFASEGKMVSAWDTLTYQDFTREISGGTE